VWEITEAGVVLETSGLTRAADGARVTRADEKLSVADG
jgi:hypothetical protein